ncbi:hypothetical protein JL721_11454 [Aureococcus anophagefferens]|nr:hypothetical protein JL721_11454 [Aureococcus anophagefferens]
MAPPPESPYTRAVEKADQLLERGLIDPGRYRDIVAGDAQFHIEAARFERDAALRQLEDLSPERAAAPRDVVFELATPPAAPRDVHFDLVGERLHTIKENDRSSSARSSSASSDAPNPRAAPLGAALKRTCPSRHRAGPAKPRRKPLLASLVRGVSRRLPSSKKATKLRAWETARRAPARRAGRRASVALPRPSAPPRPRGRISEQPSRRRTSSASGAWAAAASASSTSSRSARAPARGLRDEGGPARHVALCDFGIAAVGALDGDDGGGATPRRRSFCGTVEYMAPELLRGESHSRPWTALALPRLDDDGESDDDDDRARDRRARAPPRPDHFRGFAFAGDGAPRAA